jgi:NAD(P)-dependent dehydrogenase (short-subunit alcohol dehydrogenase family)
VICAGRTAVVTGAASGIGRALVLELAGRGVRVAASDIDGTGLAETAARCGPAARVRCDVVDVADRAAVLAWADDVAADFGVVNLVVNNAGVATVATVEDLSFDDLDWILGINLLGVINGSKAFLPALIASGDGHLVNLSSVFGLIAPPTQSAYATAKFGVRGFTECLRQEMIAADRPVTVHCVHPGGIKTNIARNARMSPAMEGEEDLGGRFERMAPTTPEVAARKILRGVERDKARILIGPDAYLLLGVQQLLGSRYEGLVGRLARRANRRAAAATTGQVP